MSVYFVQIGEGGPVKIGHSRNPYSRLESYQVGHHEKLNMIRITDGAKQGEAWFHAEFSHLRIRGEWFHFDPEMMTASPPDFVTAPCNVKVARELSPFQISVTNTERDIKAHGVAVQSVCDAAGVNRATYQRWKSGQTMPNMKTWQRFLDAYLTAVDAVEAAP